MNDTRQLQINRQFRFSAQPAAAKTAAPAWPGGRFSWPFPASHRHGMQAPEVFSKVSGATDGSGFVT